MRLLLLPFEVPAGFSLKVLPLYLIFCGWYTPSKAQIKTVVDVNLNTQRSTEGVSTFDRDVFINLHSSHTMNDWENYELNEVVNELGINFGRSVGGVTWQMNRIREAPDRPGFFDLSHMATLGKQNRDFYSSRTSIHPYEPGTFVMTSHTSPLFPNGTATSQGWQPAAYEAVGQFYAYLLKEYYGGNGESKPDYVEVINEPFVHAGDLNTTTAELSRFHNVVADSIRFHNPEVAVGGYTAAWPEFERNNFGVWDNTWRTFIDIAGENMDFLSFHLYDTPIPNDEKQRKGSNVEAIFDMIEQYSMLQLKEVKPMLISEYGACCADWEGPYYEERDWMQLKSISSITMSIMERPHKILKAIPFIVDKAIWYSNSNGYPYPYVLLENTNGGFQWEYTHLRKYYELWSEVSGERVDSWAHDPDIQIDAYVQGNKAFVILNNLEHDDRLVQLNVFETTGNDIQSVFIKHLHAINNIPQLSKTTESVPPDQFLLGAEATAILEYTFADQIEGRQKQEEKKYYSDKYLQSITANSPRSFRISDVVKADHGEATLRLGLGRAHNKSLQPQVTFNGTPVDVPDDWRGYDQRNRNDFFGIIEIPIPYELVEQDNTISVRLDDSGGHISTVSLQVKNFDYEPVRTTVSTADFTNTQLQEIGVFPNPSQGLIHFVGLENFDYLDLTIYSIDGKIVYQGPLSNKQNELNLAHLPKGLYQLRLQSEDSASMKKLVLF
ncbi:MAG: T9SS type A sorting domain-containing protein [Bacteroidota bacterium]